MSSDIPSGRIRQCQFKYHHSKKAFNLLNFSGKFLSLLSVFLLVVLGGTFTHADGSFDHHHASDGSTVVSHATGHSHLNDDTSSDNDNLDIHCGSDLPYPPELTEINCVLRFNKLTYSGDWLLIGVAGSLELPPPRFIS
jgi:hypothetical protein